MAFRKTHCLLYDAVFLSVLLFFNEEIVREAPRRSLCGSSRPCPTRRPSRLTRARHPGRSMCSEPARHLRHLSPSRMATRLPAYQHLCVSRSSRTQQTPRGEASCVTGAPLTQQNPVSRCHVRGRPLCRAPLQPCTARPPRRRDGQLQPLALDRFYPESDLNRGSSSRYTKSVI